MRTTTWSGTSSLTGNRHDTPAVTLVDCCLVPQVANAIQHHCPMDDYPRVRAVHAHCMALPAYQRAAPDQQPDFVA